MTRPPDHRLARIALRNFKRFEELDLELANFSLLVGPNNSGKSTLLQACSLLDFCYRASLQRQNGGYEFANRTFGVDEFAAIPTAAPQDLWHERRAMSDKTAIPIRLEAELRSGEKYAFEVSTTYNRFSVKADPENAAPVDPKTFGVAFIPGFTGFWPREERRTPAVLRSMKAEGQHGGIVRNLLLDLMVQTPERWESFKRVLGEIFPDIEVLGPEFDEQVDRYIRSTYHEEAKSARGRRKPPAFDLFSAGSGFHQFVQIFASIYSENATTVLLDEPDAHLFSKLQARLHDLLQKLVGDGLQVIAASHSPELIAAADPRSIVSFANGTPRRLEVRADVAGTARTLEALENVALLLVDAYERVVVVEDRSDEEQLRWWMEKLLPADDWRRLQTRLVFLHARQRPTGDRVNTMLDAIERTFSGKRTLHIQAFVVADRDYRSDEEIEREKKQHAGTAFTRQRWRVWERTEIENYLLSREGVRGALGAAGSAGELFDIPRSAIDALFDAAVEGGRDRVRERLLDAVQREAREQKKGVEASTMLRAAEKQLATIWTGTERLGWVDAKEQVLPTLRRELKERHGASFSDRDVCRCTPEQDVGGDMRAAVEAIAKFLLGR
ncbi:MAG: AAA family ATPase [Planctomycetes bacterium]|nr:AAA family ATPase [Planctomycetota bacterium]